MPRRPRFLTIFLLALASGPAAGRPLRLASFNLEWLTASASENEMAPWKDEAELENHRRALARLLAGNVRADVVCVLETTSRAALEKLAAEPELRPMGYRVYHLESRDEATGQDVAFLSRLPLDRVAGAYIHDFFASDRLTKRSIIYLTAGRLKLGILGMHLLAHPDDKYRNRKRESQAQAAAGLVRNEIVRRGYTPVVLGDFNDFDPDVPDAARDFPSSRVLRILKDFEKRRPGDELFNAAEIMAPSQRYSSYRDFDKDGKWDNGEPASLIDHILLGESLRPRLLKAEILHEPPDGSVSDHWPVVVELRR